MCFRFPKWAAMLVVLVCAIASDARELKVCADPNNLPFSNRKREGFENKIAEMLARQMHAELKYEWQRMGRGFVREYLGKSRCDVLIGVPANYKPVLTTHPYYRSTYVFVSRRRAQLQDLSIDDPDLRKMKIGVQALDEEFAPPGDALARRGMQSSIVGFDTTGKQPDLIIRAVASGKIDLAIVWGPFAGYYARKFQNLSLTAVKPEVDPPGIPFTFAIAMGVRKGNAQLQNELQDFLSKRKNAIERILRTYNVPELELAPRQEGGE